MKKIAILLLLGAISLYMSDLAHAETRYVNDLLEITLRTGPGHNYRILKMLKSGQSLEIMETEDEWSHVRLADETTGWVFSKYLRSSPPKSALADSLQQEIEPLRKEVEVLKKENKRLIERNQEMSSQLTETTEQLETLQAQYADLQEESADYLKLKEEHTALNQVLEEKNKRIQVLEKQVSDAFMSAGLKWFLAGAGVLILGMIMGSKIASRKKHSTLR